MSLPSRSTERVQEDEKVQEEARTQSMDETFVCMESSSSGRMQDHESGRNCQGSQEDVSTTETQLMPEKLDHSLLDTSDLEAWHWNLEKAKRKFGPYFVDEQQLELFCLLPLSNTQRVKLLESIRSQTQNN